MKENLIITNKAEIPYQLEGKDFEKINFEEFIKQAEEGINATRIYYDISILTEEIYGYLKDAEEIVYYTLASENVQLSFEMDKDIIVFEDRPEENEVEEQDEHTDKSEVRKDDDYHTDNKTHMQQEKEDDLNGLEANHHNKQEETFDTMVQNNWINLLNHDTVDTDYKKNKKPAKVILFGSSKGGSGKSFTCLLSAYRYSQTHPTERIALADFDIIDGQIGISIGKYAPTVQEYFKHYIYGESDYRYLENCRVKSDRFPANIDFYLAPVIDTPEITDNVDFWNAVFEKLITNYDVVFFDSGIDYLGKAPISQLYRIADKIIVTTNPSINSVKSTIRQMQTLSGVRKNNVFNVGDRILDRVYLVLTRMRPKSGVNKIVKDQLSQYAPIVAAFGNLDEQIEETQWMQNWALWNNYPDILSAVDRIVEM